MSFLFRSASGCELLRIIWGCVVQDTIGKGECHNTVDLFWNQISRCDVDVDGKLNKLCGILGQRLYHLVTCNLFDYQVDLWRVVLHHHHHRHSSIQGRYNNFMVKIIRRFMICRELVSPWGFMKKSRLNFWRNKVGLIIRREELTYYSVISNSSSWFLEDASQTATDRIFVHERNTVTHWLLMVVLCDCGDNDGD